MLTTQRGHNFLFPVAEGTAKLLGRDHGVREPTPRREQLVRSERSQKWTSRQFGKVSTDRNKRWPWSPIWLQVNLSSSDRTWSSTPRAERRNILNSNEIHWRDQDCSHKSGCDTRYPYWRLLECRRGSKFVRFMDRIHGAAYKKSCNYKTWKFDAWNVVACQKQLRRRRSTNVPLKSRRSRTLEDGEALISSIQKMEITEKPSKSRRKSSRFRWRRWCFAKWEQRSKKLLESASESDESNKIQKTKLACIVEAHESTRRRLEPTPPKDHEDHITEKDNNSKSNCARKVASVTTGQGREQNGRYFWSTEKKKKKVHCAILMDIRHLKKCGVRTKVPLIVQDKQPTQYPRTPKQDWRTLQNCSNFQRQNVHTNMDTCPTTQIAQNHNQPLKIQLFLLNEVCTDIHLLASCGKTVRGVLLRLPNWECFFVHRIQGSFSSVCVDDIRMTGKKQNLAPMWKKLMKLVEFDEQTSFLDDVTWDALNVNAKRTKSLSINFEKCSNHERLLPQLNYYQDGKDLTQKLSEVLWTGKQRDGAIVHCFNVWLRWSQLQEGGVGNSRRIFRCMFSNSLEMLVLGSNW